MRKLKTEENEIATLIRNKDPETLESFKLLITYMCVFDELNNTNHLKNIKKIYTNTQKDSVLKISLALYTAESTLSKYRKKYLKCFHICKSLIKRLSDIFQFFNKLT